MAALSVQPARPLWWGGGLGIPLGPCCRCRVGPGGEGLLSRRDGWSQLQRGLAASGVRLRACSPPSPMPSLDTTLQSLRDQSGPDGGLALSHPGRATALALPLRRVRAGPAGRAPGRWRWAGWRGGGEGGWGSPSGSSFPWEEAASTSPSPPPGAALLGRIRRQHGDGPLWEDGRASVGLTRPVRKCTAFLRLHPPSVRQPAAPTAH